METSAKTAMNVNDIFLAIGKCADAMHMYYGCCDPLVYMRNAKYLQIFR